MDIKLFGSIHCVFDGAGKKSRRESRPDNMCDFPGHLEDLEDQPLVKEKLNRLMTRLDKLGAIAWK
jgi:hypothetical protein